MTFEQHDFNVKKKNCIVQRHPYSYAYAYAQCGCSTIVGKYFFRTTFSTLNYALF